MINDIFYNLINFIKDSAVGEDIQYDLISNVINIADRTAKTFKVVPVKRDKTKEYYVFTFKDNSTIWIERDKIC